MLPSQAAAPPAPPKGGAKAAGAMRPLRINRRLFHKNSRGVSKRLFKTPKQERICVLSCFCYALFFRAELVFADRAERANPILGDFFPRGAGRDTVVGVTQLRVIDVAADVTYIFHGCVLRSGLIICRSSGQEDLSERVRDGLRPWPLALAALACHFVSQGR